MKRLSLIKTLSLILVVGILAGGALFARYMRGRVENPSTWRSLEHPVRDTWAEEYAVYS